MSIDKQLPTVNKVKTKEAEFLVKARAVFLRYGFKRTTMAELAEEARISRPALYLMFSSKEEVFRAIIAQMFREALYTIDQGLAKYTSAQEKLNFIFEIWCVQPFEMTRRFPDAKDLLESSYQFAPEITHKAYRDFEKKVSTILKLFVTHKTKISTQELAHMATNAVPGFKQGAKSSSELRKMIRRLIQIILAGLNR